MPTTLNTEIRPMMFTSQLLRLDITTDEASVDVQVRRGGVTVMLQTYYPDHNGHITVLSFSRILDFDMGDNLWRDYVIRVAAEQHHVRVLRCSLLTQASAEAWTSALFLTPVTEERDTAIGRTELLTVFSSVAETAKVKVRYVADDLTVTEREYPLQTDEWPQLRVRPADYADASLGRLVWLGVNCGQRWATYRVLGHAPATVTALAYRNCFNVWETIYLTGTREIQPKYDRGQALINGALRTYNIDEERLVEAHTGPLRWSMVPAVHDLARSEEVRMLNADGSLGDEVTITDCKTNIKDDDHEIVDMAITYRLSQTPTVVLPDDARLRHLGVFDEPFDATYQ